MKYLTPTVGALVAVWTCLCAVSVCAENLGDGTIVTPPARCAGHADAVLSPMDLAAMLERRIVSGEGVALPDADVPVILDAGAVDISRGSWPDEFFAFATPVGADLRAARPGSADFQSAMEGAASGRAAYLSISPDTGNYEFSDSSGTVFWNLAPASPIVGNWVAPFRRASDSPSSMDPLFDPSRIVLRFFPYDGTSGGAGGSPAEGCGDDASSSHFSRDGEGAVATSFRTAGAASITNLCISAFELHHTNATIHLAADWPAESPPPENVLDIYSTTRIDSTSWTRVASFSATNPPTSISFSWPELLSAPQHHDHDATCTATTNMLVSPLDGVTVYTNEIWSCASSHPRPSPIGAFFRLGTRLAHSLGNMVVCSAIQDHGFRPDRYFMLNAAVPVEAFDATQWNTAETNNPFEFEDWVGYPAKSWASCWHLLFPTNDIRHKLTWKGRFADVPQRTELYNYYSTGDEVLSVYDTPDSDGSGKVTIHPFDLGGKRYSSWQKQERFKGRWMQSTLGGFAGTSEMGWGFSDTGFWEDGELPMYDGDIGVGAQVGIPARLSVYTPLQAVNATTAQLASDPVFNHEPSSIFSGNLQQGDIDELLARGIPALSAPMGSGKVLRIADVHSEDMNGEAGGESWPRTDLENSDWHEWLHSDIKNVAFQFVRTVFEAMKGAIAQ